MWSFPISFVSAVFLHCVNFTAAFAITGISAGVNTSTGERPFRHDINELYISGPPWDLFVLALSEFQQVNQDDPLSYYQVAGIHGLPKVPWDGVTGLGEYPGYCLHAAVTFPTWHRPYLALFEQTIWKHAQRIARSYPSHQRDLYMAAAFGLRMPYWDAFADPTFPLAASLPSVTVNTPNGTRTVDNPLYQYTFHADEGGNRFPSSNWLSQFPWTIRRWDSLTQRSNITDVNAALEHQYNAVLPVAYKLFASVSDYTNMSCTTAGGNSIESIHNVVHNAVGGQGHMSDPAISAFDPVFWLHHTNIDRLLAMWQAINPQSFVTATVNAFGSYAEPRGSVDDGDSSLLPFHSDNGSGFWTSNKARSTRTFGYAYQDVIDWNLTQATLSSNVRAQVNRLYSPNRVSSNNRQRTGGNWSNRQLAGLEGDTVNITSIVGSSESERQWTITVQVQRYAHRSPFVIDFFIGPPPFNPSAWPTASNLVGSHAQFVATNANPMHTIDFANGLTHGEVSLTRYLTADVERGRLASLDPYSVIPFLMESLQWRARDMEGGELELGSLAALSIAVGSQLVQSAKVLNQFPTYSVFEIYENITAGKPGGLEVRVSDAGYRRMS